MDVLCTPLLAGDGAAMTVSVEGSIAPVTYLCETIAFASPVRMEGTLEKEGANIRLRGRMATALRFDCHRCLAEATRPFETDVEAVFALDPDEEEDEYGYAGSVLRLDEALTDAVLLELPPLLCRADCLGLCPRCGKNRNHGPCGCLEEEETDDQQSGAFAALQVLMREKEEEDNGVT